jgi:dTDP-4-dehydrorhamnose 3,5-epimerase
VTAPPALSDADIPGLAVRALCPRTDRRASLTELWRASWSGGLAPRRIDFLQLAARGLRGLCLRPRHAESVTLVAGRVLVGLKDCRGPGGRPVAGGRALLLALDAAAPSVLAIPAGVARGFYAPEAATLLLACDGAEAAEETPGCRFDDPGLGLDWPDAAPLLSAQDAAAGSLEALVAGYAAALGAAGRAGQEGVS